MIYRWWLGIQLRYALWRIDRINARIAAHKQLMAKHGLYATDHGGDLSLLNAIKRSQEVEQ